MRSIQLRGELVHQHERIQQYLQELTEAAEHADAHELQRNWTAFERDLEAHLETEEKQLFPLVEALHLKEVKALKREHDRIRRLVSELGVCCDLRALNRTAVTQLVLTLRQHGEDEDRTLYRWVDELAPVDTRRHLLGLLAKAVRRNAAEDSIYRSFSV